MGLMDDVKNWFGSSDENSIENQKKEFREKLEKIKENGFQDKRVYDKSEVENLVNHAVINSFMIGVEEERDEEENQSSLEKLVMFNLVLTGVLVIIKVAPMLGIAG